MSPTSPRWTPSGCSTYKEGRMSIFTGSTQLRPTTQAYLDHDVSLFGRHFERGCFSTAIAGQSRVRQYLPAKHYCTSAYYLINCLEEREQDQARLDVISIQSPISTTFPSSLQRVRMVTARLTSERLPRFYLSHTRIYTRRGIGF